MTENDLLEQFKSEMTAFCEGQPLSLMLSPIEAWALLSHVQLALRHPQNTGPTSQIARRWAETIQSRLVTGPAMSEVARRGWEAKYDE